MQESLNVDETAALNNKRHLKRRRADKGLVKKVSPVGRILGWELTKSKHLCSMNSLRLLGGGGCHLTPEWQFFTIMQANKEFYSAN